MQSIWVVTMAFPMPSEAFVVAECEAIASQGLQLSVKTIRSKQGRESSDEHSSLKPDRASLRTVSRGTRAILFQPLLAIRLLIKLIRQLWSQPIHLFACIVWSLRCFELLEQCKNEKPNHVHLYWGHVPAILGWLILETLADQAFTTSLSAYDLELGWPISVEVANRSKGVRTWAKCNASELYSLGVLPDKVRVIYQGVDLECFNPQAKVAGSIVVASRLIKSKGVDFVISVIDRLRADFPDVSLSIYGDGPERRTLERLVAAKKLHKNVVFHGFVSHLRLAEALGRAEFFFLNSTHSAERLPNAIKEACAAGCCCFTNLTPGIEELIVNAETGYILPSNETETWVETFASLRSAPLIARAVGYRAHERTLRIFDSKKTSSELIHWWFGTPQVLR